LRIRGETFTYAVASSNGSTSSPCAEISSSTAMLRSPWGISPFHTFQTFQASRQFKAQRFNVQSDLEAGSNSSSRFNRSRRSRFMQRGVRCMDVLFSTDDRQEYLDLLSQLASKHALDLLAWCLMSHHAHFVLVLLRIDRSRARSEQRIAIFREGWPVICGRSVSILVPRANKKVWGHS
jgi:hypothetical protein